MITLDETSVRRLVYGGAVLGAGGGGSIPSGLAAGGRALAEGRPRFAALEELPERARLVTFSCVGTVGGPGGVDSLKPQHARAYELFSRLARLKVSGFIASEVGAMAVTYGLRESVLTGLPVVDAPCNGRAHPLGMMGSLGLHRRPSHVTEIAAVGGKPKSPQYLELAVRANALHGARIVRQAVARMGIPLAVVRNPLPVAYIRRHAAVGSLRFAHALGRVFLDHRRAGLTVVLRELARFMGGGSFMEGEVVSSSLEDRQGFTVGTIRLSTRRNGDVRMPVCNEYMMVVNQGRVLASFPDLISVFDQDTVLPLNSSAVRPGQEVTLLMVPRDRLKLGATMHDPSLLRPVESLLKVRFPEARRSRSPGRRRPAPVRV